MVTCNNEITDTIITKVLQVNYYTFKRCYKVSSLLRDFPWVKSSIIV